LRSLEVGACDGDILVELVHLSQSCGRCVVSDAQQS
jgi:hypothetical protein